MGWTLPSPGATSSATSESGRAAYQDTATSGAPIPLTVADTWYPLTNNALGALTTNDFLPVRITNLWNTVSDQFDFSQISPVDYRSMLRVNLVVTTTGANRVVDVRLSAGIGGSGPFKLHMAHLEYKAAGTYDLTAYAHFYTEGVDFTDYPAQVEITCSDLGTTVVVRDFYITLEA